MKLPQSEIKTNCQKCTFAVYTNNQQTGCKTGRLVKFVDRNNAFYNGEFHILNRFCNMYRENQQSVEIAREQIKSVFGIAIYDDGIESNVEDAISSIYSIDYDKSKLKIIISSTHHEKATYFFEVINNLKRHGFNAEFVITFKDGLDHIDFNTFNRFIDNNPINNPSHLVKVNNNAIIHPSLFKDIDIDINDNLEKIVMFEYKNVVVLPFWIVNKLYLDYNNFDKMTDSIRLETIKYDMYKKYER